MKATPNKRRHVLTILLAASILISVFQNCANNMSFQASDDIHSLLADKKYTEATVGDADSFPPLKLLFVVDNSGTMGINQINLSTAFSRMFEGSNQTNLAPFNTTAFVISTSQSIPDASAAVSARLPSASVSSFAAMNQAQFEAHRGATLSGFIPGDLVGFESLKSTDTDKSLQSFLPAPVALFGTSTGGARPVTYGSVKNRNASVDEFAQDFRKRVALLNPNLSEIDPGTRRGVLDDVIDKESGLCAMARVLKNNRNFVNPGELLSVVLVSDEDDADASGLSCVDSIVQGKSGVNYIDGRCEMTQTSLSYRAAIANPTFAKCQVGFDTGFSYQMEYKIPTTDVSYFLKSMTYDQLQTIVSYWKLEQKYDQLRTDVTYYTSRKVYDAISTPVSYHLKAPTYQIPQTNVKYYTEVETGCDIRDGAKVNCKYTYPESNITLAGASGASCDTFVSGKLPAGALYNKAGYKPICSIGAPVNKSGACSMSDTSIINCNQNYSAIMTTQLTGKVLTTCDAFVAGRLPAGAVYVDAGYLPSCGNLIVTANQVGNCTTSDLDKQNCRTDYQLASTPVTLSGVPGSTGCGTFANGRLPAGAVYNVAGYLPTCVPGAKLVDRVGACSTTDINVTNCRSNYSGPIEVTLAGRPSSSGCEATFKSQLPAGATLGNATYPVTCRDGATIAGKVGTCSIANTNIANCRTVYTAQSPTNLEGSSMDAGCAKFVQGRLPANSSYTDAGYLPTCATGLPKSKSISDSIAYGASPSNSVTAGAACGDVWVQKIISTKGISIASGTSPTCTVAQVTKGSDTLANAAQDLTCAVAKWQDTCALSGGTKRSCAPTDIAAGAKYETTPRSVTFEGTFNCNTECSATSASFCKDKTGTVGQNYFECQTTAAANVVKSNFTMEAETNPAICSAGQIRRVTNGPYQTTETKRIHVAGDASANNESNALAEYILSRSKELFKDSLPILSIFVRQPGDALGTNGSVGTAYNRLADLLAGKKRSVLSSSDQYALALEDLSSVIRTRLNRSVNFKEIPSEYRVRKVWFRKAGATSWGTPLDASLWTVNGGTITLSDKFQFEYGDVFRVEYW